MVQSSVMALPEGARRHWHHVTDFLWIQFQIGFLQLALRYHEGTVLVEFVALDGRLVGHLHILCTGGHAVGQRLGGVGVGPDYLGHWSRRHKPARCRGPALRVSPRWFGTDW